MTTRIMCQEAGSAPKERDLMKKEKPKRKLSNVRVYAKWHQQYLGAWLALTIAPIFGLNLAVYYLYCNMWKATHPTVLLGTRGFQHPQLAISLIIETALFVVAVLFLAIMTCHRITGPHQRMLRTFRDIKAGDHEVRLGFRKNDEMDDLAGEFNEMLESLLEHTAETASQDPSLSKLEPAEK